MISKAGARHIARLLARLLPLDGLRLTDARADTVTLGAFVLEYGDLLTFEMLVEVGL